jgi:hypothetical protein
MGISNYKTLSKAVTILLAFVTALANEIEGKSPFILICFPVQILLLFCVV